MTALPSPDITPAGLRQAGQVLRCPLVKGSHPVGGAMRILYNDGLQTMDTGRSLIMQIAVSRAVNRFASDHLRCEFTDQRYHHYRANNR